MNRLRGLPERWRSWPQSRVLHMTSAEVTHFQARCERIKKLQTCTLAAT
jgi:hypothetical protein